jgi:hypothetical protein
MKINIRLLFIIPAFFVFYISYGQDSVMNNLVHHHEGYQCMGKSMKCVKLTSDFDCLIDDCLRTRLPSYKFLKKWAKKNPEEFSYYMPLLIFSCKKENDGKINIIVNFWHYERNDFHNVPLLFYKDQLPCLLEGDYLDEWIASSKNVELKHCIDCQKKSYHTEAIIECPSICMELSYDTNHHSMFVEQYAQIWEFEQEVFLKRFGLTSLLRETNSPFYSFNENDKLKNNVEKIQSLSESAIQRPFWKTVFLQVAIDKQGRIEKVEHINVYELGCIYNHLTEKEKNIIREIAFRNLPQVLFSDSLKKRRFYSLTLEINTAKKKKSFTSAQ